VKRRLLLPAGLALAAVLSGGPRTLAADPPANPPAAGTAPAGQDAETINKIMQDNDPMLSGRGFTYDPAGRRDPFRSLVDAANTAGKGPRPRGIAGMPVRRDVDGATYLRPLLDVTRAQTRAACAELGLTPWQDPHNDDPRFARARVRRALPLLTDVLGDGLIANLARTARHVAADMVVLDALADEARATATTPDGHLDVGTLDAMPAAIRGRVLHGYARTHSTYPAALSAAHVDALDALITNWHGQGPVALPGGVWIGRDHGHLRTGRQTRSWGGAGAVPQQ
jgi:hypothetical protein